MVDEVSPGGRIERVWRLRGGISMGMHAVRIVWSEGKRHTIVLRRYNPKSTDMDATACRREFRVLELLERLAFPAPRPIWLDEHGRLFGTPAMATSFVAGRATLDSEDRDAWLTELAETLARLHALQLAGAKASFLPSQSQVVERMIRRGPRPVDLRLFPESVAIWDRLRALWKGRVAVPPVIVHDDYWAGNTLWHRGRISAVVDWEQPALGDPGCDVGYCRMDLALFHGAGVADEFLAKYEAAAGRRVENLAIWDLYGALRPLPDPAEWLPGYDDLRRGRAGLTPRLVRSRLRRWMREATSRAFIKERRSS
jgi:aminoglycoside phosphotransferase (APT) family kinase protein